MFKFFKDGNKKAKESYYTFHNLKKAQKLSSGKDVRIGIIDWLFGNTKSKLYSGCFDATEKSFLRAKEHGYAMANTLKEIAPNCEIFAINAITKESLKDDNLRVEFLEKAINFAIENNIKILTYSHQEIKDKNAIKKLNKILELAEKNKIITIFLHCNQKRNIMPIAINSTHKNSKADVFHIYQYDYSMLNPIAYKKWLESDKKDNTCFLSWSSMCPVLAGFIALLIEINKNISKQEIINILNTTQHQNNVIDIYSALIIAKKSK